MTPEIKAALFAPPTNAIAPPTPNKGQCSRVVVRTKDGREFDLGVPDSVFFKVRVWLYRCKRWGEFKNG